jgi:hypothetical protein
MAYMQLVVPNSINDGRSIPSIQVLVDGLQIDTFMADGTPQGPSFCNNPVWIILDILRRSGWGLAEIDLPTFSQAAAYCDQPIPTTDLNGNTINTSRFQCNLILQSRRSAGDVIRGIRNASRLYLTYSTAGLLQMKIENTLALQQPQPAQGSNAVTSLDGGWPAYEFGDGTNGTTGIARAEDQSSTFRITSRSSADTPNRFSIEFQDAFNSYQQDSVTLVNPDDVRNCGFEVSATPTALGIPNYNQAGRIVALCLSKSVEGNTYIEFQTSVRALGLQPGDIIAVTHSREGYDRTPFRVVKVSPGQNFRRARIRAQIHDDAWYTDNSVTNLFNSGPAPSYRIGVPRAIAGVTTDHQFFISETASEAQDGTANLVATVEYAAPPSVSRNAPVPPLVSLASVVSSTDGTLPANTMFYYALTSIDASGNEGALSFAVLAITNGGASTYSVSLREISLPASATSFNVYRGSTPAELVRISSDNSPATTFVDNGLPSLQNLPPDANYDHANFYWRMEVQGITTVTTHSLSTIGNSSVQMASNDFAGMTVRVIAGTGARQERVVASNSSTTLTVAPLWTIEPDNTSTFVISQTGYQFGASGKTDQVQFGIPNSSGDIIQICGRSANVYDVESPYELATVTRWQIGGAGSSNADGDVPPAPLFGLDVLPEGGGIELGSLGFHTLDNTRTISLGTVTLYYYDESATDPPLVLANDIGATDLSLVLTTKPPLVLPQYVAIGQEIVRLNANSVDGTGFAIDRGIHTTTAAIHIAGTVVLPLGQLTLSFPFLDNFFGTPACGNWSQSIVIANARICSAELFVTNSQGNSPVSAAAFTSLMGGGLRTLTGGQITLQVPGYLAVQNGAVPPLDPGAIYSIRDVYAYVGTAPAGTTAISLEVTLDDQIFCPLTIPAVPTGTTRSLSIDGATLPVLRAGKQIGLNILSVGDQAPGSDLTVVIRV